MPEFFIRRPKKDYPQDKEAEEHDFQAEDQRDPVRTLLDWRAPARPFRKKDRSYYTTIAILVILLVLIALLAKEVLLIGVLLALTFVVYVLGFVSPEEISYKISTQGITIGDHFYFWENLDSFWFSEKEGHRVLNVLTHLRFPGMLMLLLDSQAEEQVRKTVARYLPFHEIAPKSLLDKWAESLQKHFPLENPHH